MKFFVFYSNKCQYCERLLKIIHKEKLSNQCQLICFEANPERIPPFITSVPTIISKNLSKPLIGIDAVEWVENRKYFNQTTNNVNNNNVVNPRIVSALKELEFNKSEVNTISDRYTTIGDGIINKPMLDFDKININAPITNDISNKKIEDIKITNDLQNKKLKEIITLRKLQLAAKLAGSSKIIQNKK